MKALISPNESVFDLNGNVIGARILDVRENSFPVPPPLYWLLCDNTVTARNWCWTANGFEEIPRRPTMNPLLVWRENVEVSRIQARSALYLAGKLEMVDAWAADPSTPVLQKMAWQDATTFARTSPTVLSAGAALGLTDQELDDLFSLALTIKA